MTRYPLRGAVVALVLTLLTAGCSGSSGGGTGGKLSVVAAENFYGSIAAQLGGDRVNVHSVISDPATDPHDYEPTPADARLIAGARYVIENAIGYDPWAAKLIAADHPAVPAVLAVGDLLHLSAGANPHVWYSPADVAQVVDRISADYTRLDPADGSYFAQQHTAFVNGALATYRSLITSVKARYVGTPIGASESIVVPLAEALGLRMQTPETFLDAVSEGSEPTAADKAKIDAQITSHAIAIYVFNSQNATPDVQAQVAEARAAGIPTVTVTETLSPASASFQDWQVGQLRALETALGQATGHR